MSTRAAWAPRDDRERLSTIDRMGVVDMAYDERFQRVLRIAARLFDVPVAVLTVVTRDETIIKASLGIDTTRIPRGQGVCETVVERDAFVHHRDVQCIPELASRDYSDGISFYAGFPIRTQEGHAIGTFCIADSRPRDFGDADRAILEDLADNVMDLLERHRAERERDESVERLRIISEAPPFGIVEIDHDGRISHASATLLTLLGYEAHEALGRPFLDFVHPPARSTLYGEFEKAIEGSFLEGEALFVAKGGRLVTLAWSTCPATTADGSPRTVSVVRDVSERARTRNEIAMAQERYHQLFESSRDAMAFVSPDRSAHILEVNGAFETLLGYERAEIVGKLMSETDVELDIETYPARKRWRDLTTRGFTDEYERELSSHEGGSIPVSVCAWMLRDSEGEPFAILCRLRDIRAQRRQERVRAELQEELEERVHVRTLELEETLARLRAAERLASIGTLASGVAHQINNPIGAIQAASEYALLCGEDADARQTWKRALEDAVEHSKRCGRIVRSMLQFSRGERTERWPEDLELVVRRAIRVAESQSGERTVDIKFEPSARPLIVEMNPIEMEQVFVNLVENAIEAKPRSEVVRVRLGSDKDFARVEVIDDGIGIEAVHRRRVFDPFYTTRQTEGGTGLGLSVADGIVRDLGGEIRIEDGSEAGTRVTVRLPLFEDARAGA